MRPLARSLLTLACLAAFDPRAARAQGADCAEAADQTSLNACADRAYKAADGELNAAWRDLAGRLDGAALDRLKTAERAWIAWRDAMCAFVAGPSEGGSIRPMVLANCRAGLTAQQTDLLRAQASCAEGDVSCAGR